MHDIDTDDKNKKRIYLTALQRKRALGPYGMKCAVAVCLGVVGALSVGGTVPDGTVPLVVMRGLSPTPAPAPDPFVSSVVETPHGWA